MPVLPNQKSVLETLQAEVENWRSKNANGKTIEEAERIVEAAELSRMTTPYDIEHMTSQT